MQRQKNINLNNKILKTLSIFLLAISIGACSSKKIIVNKITNTTKEQIIYGDNKDIIFANTIYFEFDSYELQEKNKENLKLVARYLNTPKNSHISIKLDGYCDDLGTDKYNYSLGLKRANVAKEYLVKLGVNETRIKVNSYGKDLQKIKGNTEDSRQFNRKVVIILE